MDNINKYKAFAFFKSTAITLPILPIYINSDIGVSVSDIIYYSWISFIVPFFLEIPSGMLSDAIGYIRTLCIATLFFIMSFIVLMMQFELSYVYYILLITVASVLYSGTDMALLYRISEGNQIGKIKAEVDHFFYKYTSLLFLISGVLYSFNVYLPIIFQIISLMISLLFLRSIDIEEKVSRLMPVNRIGLRLFYIRPYIVPLLLFSSLFIFGLNVNVRTISIQFFENNNNVYYICILFIFTNFISSLSAKYYKERYSEDWNIALVLFYMIASLSIAYLFISIDNIVMLSLGFCLICIVKPVYRSYIYTLYMSFQEKEYDVATTLSYYTLLSSILASFFSFLYGKLFINFQQINIVLSIFIFIVGCISVIYFIVVRSNQYRLNYNSFSTKESYLLRENNQIFLYRNIWIT